MGGLTPLNIQLRAADVRQLALKTLANHDGGGDWPLTVLNVRNLITNDEGIKISPSRVRSALVTLHHRRLAHRFRKQYATTEVIAYSITEAGRVLLREGESDA